MNPAKTRQISESARQIIVLMDTFRIFGCEMAMPLPLRESGHVKRHGPIRIEVLRTDRTSSPGETTD